MATFVFRESKYDTVILEKVSNEGHYIKVDKHLIVHEHNGVKDKPPVAIKVDGLYHLLQGSVDLKHNQPTILCITKFTMKKCKIEAPIKVNKLTAAQEHQAKWNTPQPMIQTQDRTYRDHSYQNNDNYNDSYSGQY